MEDNEFGLFDGCVYKKIPEAEYTYIYCSGVKEYLLRLLANAEVADQVAPYINPITNLLSEPACRLIKPIKLDYNFIEVNDGYCFNIWEKKFIKNPKTLKGSPRAFVLYDYKDDVVPYPKPFIEGTGLVPTEKVKQGLNHLLFENCLFMNLSINFRMKANSSLLIFVRVVFVLHFKLPNLTENYLHDLLIV